MPAHHRHLLADSSIFSALDDQELDALLALAQSRQIKARDYVLRKGDAALHIFVIVSGRLKVMTSGAEGRQATLSIMGPGEVFGEVAALDGEPRSATITAIEKAEVLVIARDDFFGFLKRTPAVATKLLETLAKRLRLLSERVEDLSFLDVPGRLAKQLSRLAERYGRDIGSGAIRIELKLSQQELGDLVGASRESVNKHLRSWIDEGLVEQQDGKLVLARPADLRKVGETRLR